MFGIVNAIVTNAHTFARCVRAELDKAGTPQETREQLAVIFDNALIRYAAAKPDGTTQEAVRRLRPALKRTWIE